MEGVEDGNWENARMGRWVEGVRRFG